MKKKLYMLAIGLILTGIGQVFAQQDIKAREILDKTLAVFQQSKGVSLTFGGSQEGTLMLQGTCFYLDCGGVKSWFDGKTQWSYVGENEEVTISTPTPEELQSVNPYAILTSYRQHYNYQYKGVKNQGGKSNYEILLTPRTSGNHEISSVVLHISTAYQPADISVKQSNGEQQKFIIRSYKTVQGLTAASFRFDAKKYPNAEIIDMR